MTACKRASAHGAQTCAYSSAAGWRSTHNTQDGSAHLECLDTQRIPDLIKFIFELGLDLGQGEDEADIGRDRKDGEHTFAS